MQRIRFYLDDYSEAFWNELPNRVNKDDKFYMDLLLKGSTKDETEGELMEETLKYLSDVAIFYCKEVIWAKDSKGFYQQVSLVDCDK